MGSISSRRSFFVTAGAALAAPLAAGASNEADRSGEVDALRARVAELEERAALRDLARSFVRQLNTGDREAAAALGASSSSATAGGERIVRLRFDETAELDAVEIAADGRARTRIGCVAEIETPLESCPLVEMARAQGGGVARRSERGVLEVEYDRARGAWRVARAAFRPA